jgi:magnesium-transporting ATPase (P-type)
MLTGDNKTTAEAVARKLTIDRVEADVLPDQKANIVKQLQAEGKIVAMQAMVLTMHRHSHKRMLASLWAPTSPWEVPG